MPTLNGDSPSARHVSVVVRPMHDRDVDAVDHVMRVAFGTFLGVRDPATTFGEAQYVRSRYAAEPSWAFVAEHEGDLVGSVFATRWGSFGFLGPLTIRPDLWDRGVGRQLIGPVVDLFDGWPVRLAGLHTFAQSAKHVGLYQRFDFWPQHLTAIMTKGVDGSSRQELELFSELGEVHRATTLSECAELTDALYEGLDVGHDIRSVQGQSLGDTVLLRDGARLAGFAVCHCGAGEAGSDTLYVKFAAVRLGPHAQWHFDRLLTACERLAQDRHLTTIVAGVNTGRRAAYRHMLASGYRASGQGVRMHRPDVAGRCEPFIFVIDDLR
jgi:predicted N-acetyltransferase YhbS